jgi:hypothetical protein
LGSLDFFELWLGLMNQSLGDVSWERMIRAVEAVRERLLRAAAALDTAAVPYAVVGGNAIAAWVSRVDQAAVRNTQDVDLLLRAADLPAATQALAGAGFIFQEVAGVPMFLDGPSAGPRDALHVLFAGEKVLADDMLPNPDVAETEYSGSFRLLNLDALVRMKLTSFRRKDQVHLLDLFAVGLIDASWVPRFPPELGARLQHLIDTPNG